MSIVLDGTTGITTPGLTNTGTETIVNLTTTGNTILGDASTDTLNVGNGGLVKDASGNVGIGTSSPSYALHVYGNANASVSNVVENANAGTSGFARFLALSNAGNAQFGMTSSGYTDITGAQDAMLLNANGASGGIAFALDGVVKGKFDSSGNLLVGTTSTDVTNGAFALQGSGAINSYMRIGHKNGSNSGADFLALYYNGTQIGGISQSGTTGVAFNTSSDYRLKNTIAPMTGALAKVAQLKPCTYKWNADGSDGEGFIAHELQEVVPDCVTGEKDAVDAEGKPIYQGIDTSFLVATLTAAIQEQQALITTLTDRITALESKA